MVYKRFEWNDLRVVVRLGCFNPAGGDAGEFHAVIEVNAACANAKEQYLLLEEAVQRLMRLPELKKGTLVWKHFFASDAINQTPYLTESADEAVSVVQQPPLNGSKASLWLYFAENVRMIHEAEDGTSIMQRPRYKHLFNTRLHERSVSETQSPLMPLPSSIEHQTSRLFDRYIQSLSRHNCTLARNCIRTWLYVQDVDVQYAGMVSARLQFFENEGLTPQTHYIASTGIEGRYIFPDVLVLMDAYAIEGISSDQVKHLKALTHLNPTHEYGVTFERGTAVDYGDRRHIFISGTASINNRGEIVHPLDVEKQTARTFENIQALLAEAEATMTNVACMTVYLRDTADYTVVKRYIDSHHPDIPTLIVLAPVCRPGWLIEVECIAIKSIKNERFAAF
jgi:enamine deaminase RidA (YjgF/YER057c/UK114 family)